MILDVATQILKSLGYDVITATNGDDAVKIYSQMADEIDLVLLDMVMPEKGGGETYTMLKKLNPDIKVLLSSGYSVDGRAQEILQQGCKGFIQKPFTVNEISRRVKEVLSS